MEREGKLCTCRVISVIGCRPDMQLWTTSISTRNDKSAHTHTYTTHTHTHTLPRTTHTHTHVDTHTHNHVHTHTHTHSLPPFCQRMGNYVPIFFYEWNKVRESRYAWMEPVLCQFLLPIRFGYRVVLRMHRTTQLSIGGKYTYLTPEISNKHVLNATKHIR